MSRYFRNSPKDADQGWKRVQRFSGDMSSFYLRHDSFIKVTSEASPGTSPGRNFTITKRAHSQEVNKNEEKDTLPPPGRNFTIPKRAHSQDVNVKREKVKEEHLDTDLRSKLRKVDGADTAGANKKEEDKKKKPVVKKKRSSKIDSHVTEVSDSVKLREKCQNDLAEERSEETDRIARHAGEESVNQPEGDISEKGGSGGTPDILRSSKQQPGGNRSEEESKENIETITESKENIETVTESKEEKLRQESHLIGIIENFYDQVNEAKDKSILLASSANSAIENAAIIEDIIQSKESDGNNFHSIDKSTVDQALEAANASKFHSDETKNIAEIVLEAKEKALLYFHDISASNCKVETPDIIRSSRLAKNTPLSKAADSESNESALVVFDYLQDCKHCIEELEIIESQILKLSDTAVRSAEEARRQQEKLNEVATRSDERDEEDLKTKEEESETSKDDEADPDGARISENRDGELVSNEKKESDLNNEEINLKEEEIVEEKDGLDDLNVNEREEFDHKNSYSGQDCEESENNSQLKAEDCTDLRAGGSEKDEDFGSKHEDKEEEQSVNDKQNAEDLSIYQTDIEEIQLWISDKSNALNTDNVGHDLETVEALRIEHEGLERDLSALGDKIMQLDEKASKLMDTDSHKDSREIIYEKQKDINEEWTQLCSKANQRKVKLLDSYDLQRFLSDCKDLMSWVSSMESFICTDELATDVTGAEALLERHQEHRTEIDARSGTFQAFEQFGQQLLTADHFASAEVQEKLESMNNAKEDLEKAWMARRMQLDQCLELQLFYRDCEQAENWMTSRESFLSADDATDSKEDNVEAVIKKHAEFDEAVGNQEEKIASFEIYADHLIHSEHYAANNIEEKKKEILERWDKFKESKVAQEEILGKELIAAEVKRAEEKKQEDLIRDLELWLAEVEKLVSTDEVGEDLVSVQDMMKEHQLVEADIIAHEDRIRDTTRSCQTDSDDILDRREKMRERFSTIQDLAAHRLSLLSEANNLYQFFRDIDTEESWIQDMKQIVASEDCEGDLLSVQSMLEDHERLERELDSHETAVQQVEETGEQLGGAAIEQMLQQLTEVWQDLKLMAHQRRKKLEESIIFQQFLAKLEEEEAWFIEEHQRLTDSDLGNNIDVKELLKEHEDFEMEISVHGNRCADICEAGQKLIDEGNNHSDSIAQRCEQLRDKMYNLGELSSIRQSNLMDNSDYLEFMLMAEQVESWIADSECQVRSEEFGDDVSSVQTLLTKQETFNIELRAFESEEIRKMSSLKDQLILSNHAESETINEKFQTVISLWDRLLSDNSQREQRLLELHDEFRRIEEVKKEEETEQLRIAELERIEKERLEEEARLEQLRIAELERIEQERLEEEARIEQLRIAELERIEKERLEEEARLEQLRIAELERIEQERLEEEARIEQLRIAELERIEQERLEEEARIEQLRIAELKRIEQERLEEEARIEQLRIAELKRIEQERLEEEARLEQLRLAEEEEERKRLEEEEIARRVLEAERRIAEAERLKEIQRQEKIQQEEQRKIAEAERKKKLVVFEEFLQREAEFIAGNESPAFFGGSKNYQVEKLKHFLGLNIKVDEIESNQSAESLLDVSKKEEISHKVTELFPGISIASYLTVSEAALDKNFIETVVEISENIQEHNHLKSILHVDRENSETEENFNLIADLVEQKKKCNKSVGIICEGSTQIAAALCMTHPIKYDGIETGKAAEIVLKKKPQVKLDDKLLAKMKKWEWKVKKERWLKRSVEVAASQLPLLSVMGLFWLAMRILQDKVEREHKGEKDPAEYNYFDIIRWP